MKNNNKITALLCRLSKEDELRGDSQSIQTQKKMLLQYAKSNNFINTEFYVDDGYSGTNFNRPDFKRLMNDIDKGIIGTVIVKDLSRLGREYIEVGTLIEKVFPDKGIRFITINDDVDSINGIPDYMPFKNIINEMYAKDISKKIRSAYKAKALNGEYTGAYAPYGYIKDPNDKHHLIIDAETSAIVKKIFNLACNGYSAYQISQILKEEKVLKPRDKMIKDTGKYQGDLWTKYPYDWRPQTIYRIISNEEYLGHLVCNKNSTKSFKTKKLLPVDKNYWIKTLNTHEAIIDEDTFNKANLIFTRIKHRPKKNDINIFQGLLRCSSCGKALSIHDDKRSDSKSYCCVTYRNYGKDYCSSHYIRYDLLYEYVLNDINSILESFWKNNDSFIESLKKEYLK
ncbi:MAG: recombinase family protein [Anaeroplasmataceae bacterium]